MSKLFTEVNGRVSSTQFFEKFTIDCNKIVSFKNNKNISTDVFFNDLVIEIDMNYYDFQQKIMGEIIKNEHQNDVLKLMAGYLSNNVITSISPEVLIKDCKGIIKKIASDDNTL
jgi:hypothetical protein